MARRPATVRSPVTIEASLVPVINAYLERERATFRGLLQAALVRFFESPPAALEPDPKFEPDPNGHRRSDGTVALARGRTPGRKDTAPRKPYAPRRQKKKR